MTEESEEFAGYTKYEKARMLGSRALQLAMGAPFLIKLSEKDLEQIGFNPVEIAKMEFEEGVLPITVKRPLPGERLEKEEEAAEKKAA
jgi:DNA-directed RNA polymerase subunit K